MKAFVIYLKNKEHSVQSSRSVLKSLMDYKIDAELFAGVSGVEAMERVEQKNKTLYPFGIKNHELTHTDILPYIIPELQDEFREKFFGKLYERQLINSDSNKMSSPGVMGCFFSHYALWKKCIELNEPIMIFEDDVKFYRTYEPVVWNDVLILALGKQTYLHDPWKTYLEKPTGYPQAITWRNFSMPGCVGYAIKPHAAKVLVKFYRNHWYPADNAINSSLCEIQMATYQMGRTTLPDEGNVSSIRVKP